MASCILCGKPVRGFARPRRQSPPPAGYTGIHDVQQRPVHPACAQREACTHDRTRNLYRRGADRAWLKIGERQCVGCGKVVLDA